MLELGYKSPQLYLARALAYIWLDRNKDALSDCQTAFDSGYEGVELYLIRTLAYLGLYRYEEALEDSKQKQDLDDKRPDLYLLRAQVYMLLNRNNDALSDCDHAYQLGYRGPKLHLLRAGVYMDLNRNEDAILELSKLRNRQSVERYAFHALACIRLGSGGNLQETRKFYDKARKSCNRGLTLADDKNAAPNVIHGKANINAELYCIRAQTYSRLGRYADALSDYQYGLNLKNNNVRLYRARGFTYLDMKYYDNALKDGNRAIELDSEDPELYGLRARAYNGLGRYVDAELDCRSGLKKLDDKDKMGLAGTHYRNNIQIELSVIRARAYLGLGRYEEAEWDCSYWLKKLDDGEKNRLDGFYTKIESLMVRARTYISLGRYADAESDCRSVQNLDGQYPELYELRAKIHKAQGKLKEARKYFEIAKGHAEKRRLTKYAEEIQQELNELDRPNPR